MKPDSPFLTKSAHDLDQTLDDLENAIIDRNVLEKRLSQSFAKLTAHMKLLDRQWDRGDHTAYQRLYSKHIALQKSLVRAQNACNRARQKLHERRDSYDAARLDLAGWMIENAAEKDHLHRCQGALNRTLGHLVDRLKSTVGPHGDKPAYAVRDGAYDYIPFDVPDFLSYLVRLNRLLAQDRDYAADGECYRPVSFLEIGCGPGRNVLIARESELIPWSRLAGFDINPDQIAIGRQAFGLEAELQVADAMSFDYGDWDVVFTYRPFKDLGKQRALEAHMVRSMRPTAYLLAPLSLDLSIYPELTPSSVSRDIWKKAGATSKDDC